MLPASFSGRWSLPERRKRRADGLIEFRPDLVRRRSCECDKRRGRMGGVVREEGRRGFIILHKSTGEYPLKTHCMRQPTGINEGRWGKTDGVVVWALCQWFSSDVVEPVRLGSVIGQVVYASRGEMDPAIRYATEDDLIRDVDVDDEAEWGVLFRIPGGGSHRSRLSQGTNRGEVRLTSDGCQGARPGAEYAGIRPRSSAR